MFCISKRHAALVISMIALLLGSARDFTGQERIFPGAGRNEKTPSRAEVEAEHSVSLSFDRIYGILDHEPGLLLQVKKLLVREAFEQGRLLDSSDLTDEALYRLLREDEGIRILVTHEIEDRGYLEARPTRAERDREERRKAAEAEEGAAGETKLVDAERGREAPREQRKRQPEMLEARDCPPSSAPNHRDDGAENDTSHMATVRPDELPGLLPASASGLSAQRRRDSQEAAREEECVPEGSSQFSAQAGTKGRPRERSEQMFAASLERPPRVPRPATPGLDANTSFGQHRPNPYASVPSLYDLYFQAWRKPDRLERFGTEVFRNGTGNFDELPMDLPVGPDYVLGPGDSLNIDLWGSTSQRLQRVVDREGQVTLPEAGPVLVSGRSLGDVQHLVQNVMRTEYRDVRADVSLARLRTVRVYVVGDVERPGPYDISSLSTPLNALYAAGGPTLRGSMRSLQHYRGKQLVQAIDVYGLLLHGIAADLQRIQPGDTLLVPPAGTEVTVEGMVRRPAIYELTGKASLTEVLELAGGVLPSGVLRHINVERVVAHEKRVMVSIDVADSSDPDALRKTLDDFEVQAADQIRISAIPPYSEQAIYLDGHVLRPGKYPYKEGMKVTDLVRSYADLLPEPARGHAEIIRLVAPDHAPAVLAFNLGNALEGKEPDLRLQPFDTVRVFGRYDFEDPPVVTVSGEVRDPGDHVTNGVTHLRDAIYLAGGVTVGAELEDAQIFRQTSNGQLRVIGVNLSKGLAGEEGNNILLESKDRVFVHRSLAKVDPPTVTVRGEVAKPGKYPLGEGMTASELVRLAGGLRRSADGQAADLTRYLEQNGGKHVGEQRTIDIAEAMTGAGGQDVPLRAGDLLTIPQIAGWSDIGSVVTLQGEVVRPGTYGLREGERLSSLLQRAGGFRSSAYPYGAILLRAQIREMEERTRGDLVRRVQAEGAALKLIPETDAEQKMAKDASLAQWQAVIEKLQNTPPSGRLVMHISSEVRRWANTPADPQMRAGDVLIIPKQANFVMVDGAVYNPTAVTFQPGRSAEWFVRQAGGPTVMANKKAIFVIRGNGSIVGGSGSWLGGGARSAELRPGDMVMVPEKALSGTTRWRTLLQSSQLLSAVGIGIQVARSF